MVTESYPLNQVGGTSNPLDQSILTRPQGEVKIVINEMAQYEAWSMESDTQYNKFSE